MNDDDYTKDEIARRRDEVVRRMANTPPRPKTTPRPKKKRKAGAIRVARKARAGREG